jgi:NAD(P)-dependent dehydrogenase (short-subunit alcohol dehydrogenase family)
MGKNIIITGAGSGIGKACAQRFLAAGWNVALLGRRIAPLQQVAADHLQAMALVCDVSDAGQVARAFAQVADRFGHLDVLFNNAGTFTPAAPINEIPLSDWQVSLAVNLTGSFLCARAAFGIMRAQDPQGGRIINNGSISAQTPRPGSTCYTTTKHAISGLTKTLSLDGRPFNIAAGQIDIGNAGTDLVAGLDRKNRAAGLPGEEIMDVSHAARAVLQMAELPLDANIQTMTIMATKMPFVGRG